LLNKNVEVRCHFKDNHFTGMCSGSEAGSYLRLTDSCITQLKAQGPPKTWHESKEEEKRKLGPRLAPAEAERES